MYRACSRRPAGWAAHVVSSGTLAPRNCPRLNMALPTWTVEYERGRLGGLCIWMRRRDNVRQMQQSLRTALITTSSFVMPTSRLKRPRHSDHRACHRRSLSSLARRRAPCSLAPNRQWRVAFSMRDECQTTSSRASGSSRATRVPKPAMRLPPLDCCTLP